MIVSDNASVRSLVMCGMPTNDAHVSECNMGRLSLSRYIIRECAVVL